MNKGRGEYLEEKLPQFHMGYKGGLYPDLLGFDNTTSLSVIIQLGTWDTEEMLKYLY
jgi:hypothetical protein